MSIVTNLNQYNDLLQNIYSFHNSNIHQIKQLSTLIDVLENLSILDTHGNPCYVVNKMTKSSVPLTTDTVRVHVELSITQHAHQNDVHQTTSDGSEELQDSVHQTTNDGSEEVDYQAATNKCKHAQHGIIVMPGSSNYNLSTLKKEKHLMDSQQNATISENEEDRERPSGGNNVTAVHGNFTDTEIQAGKGVINYLKGI